MKPLLEEFKDFLMKGNLIADTMAVMASLDPVMGGGDDQVIGRRQLPVGSGVNLLVEVRQPSLQLVGFLLVVRLRPAFHLPADFLAAEVQPHDIFK